MRSRRGKNILTVVRFIFPPEKPVVAHRQLRDESAFRSGQGCRRRANKDQLFYRVSDQRQIMTRDKKQET